MPWTTKKPRYFIEHMVTRRARGTGLKKPASGYSRLGVGTMDPWIASRSRRNIATAVVVFRPTAAQAASAVRELLDISKEEWRAMVELYRMRVEKTKLELKRLQQKRRSRKRRGGSKLVIKGYKAEVLRIEGERVRVSVLGKNAVKALEKIKKELGVKGVPVKTRKLRRRRAIRR